MFQTVIDLKNCHIAQCYPNIIQSHGSRFYQIYKHIMLEIYNVFPVPQRFLDSILDFINTSNCLEQKYYSCFDILNTYTKNWKYYQVFKFNTERMIKKNIDASITVIKFKSVEDLNKIFDKYKPISANFVEHINLDTKAAIYQYTENFNLCLLVNASNQTQFSNLKQIQHQLIHWMQVTLNAESYTTYGKFTDIAIPLTKRQEKFLSSCFMNQSNILTTARYILNGFQFQPWCANSVQNFQYLNLDLNKFKSVIESENNFKFKCIQLTNNLDIHYVEVYQELLLVTQICYFASLNNPADDRYWYLIESIKQNNR